MASKALKGLTIKIGGDTSDLLDSLKNVEKRGNNLSKELTQINRLLKLDPSNTELLAQKQKVLADAISNTEEKLGKLKDAEKEAQEQFEKGEITEEQYRALQREIVATEQKLKKYEKEAEDVDQAQKNVADSADKAGKKLDDAGDKSEDAGDKFGKAEAAAAALGAAFIALGKNCIEAFNEVDEGADNVIKATGATGTAAKELTDVYKKVAGQVVGSFDEIGATVGEVNIRFGYTGERLEQVTVDFLKFAEITGVNSTEAVKAVTRALNDSGIPLEEYGSLLDYLAKAGQSAGIDVTTLADSLSTNGATMRAMGFDTKETIALLAQFELSGADAATMLSGMKKAMTVWTESSKDGSKEFAKTVDGIKNGSITAGDAMDIFGKKAGPLLVDAIKSGKFEYQDMLDVIEDSEGTLESTFGELEDGGYKTELTFQKLKLEAADLGETILEEVGPVFEDLVDDFKQTGTAEKFGSILGKLAKTILPPLAKVVGFVADNFETMVVTVGTAVTAFKVFKSVMSITTAISAARTAISGLSSGVSAATKMQYGWNAAMSANPIGAVISAVAWLTSSILVLNSATEAAIDPVELMTEEQRALHDAIEESTQAYRDMKDETEEETGAIGGQMDYVTDLADELFRLADESGRVKDADKARADFIIGELNDALGTEYSRTGDIIDNYKKLKDSIYDVITAKEAELLLSAHEDDYQTAIEQSNAAWAEFKEAEKDVKDAQNAYNTAQDEYWEALRNSQKYANEWGDAIGAPGALLGSVVDAFSGGYGEAETAMNEAKALLDKMEANLDKARKKYDGYKTTAENYRTAQTAALQGDYETVIGLLSSESTAYKQLSIDIDEETKKVLDLLDQTAYDAGIAAENTKKNYNAGIGSIDEDAVAEAKEKALLTELLYQAAEAGVLAKQTRENFEKGVDGYTEEMVKEAESGYQKALDKFSTAYNDASVVGQEFGQGIADGISLKNDEIGAASIAAIRAAINAAKKEAEIESPSRRSRREIGGQFGEGIKLGITDKTKDVKKAATDQMAATLNAYNVKESDAQKTLITLGERQADRFTAGQMTAATANAGMLEKILGAIEKGQVLLLDGDTLVGGTANKMDNALGTIRALAARGAL